MQIRKVAAVVAVLVMTLLSAWLGVRYLGAYLKLGLDLKGGVQVRLQAADSATSSDMDKVMSIMGLRIDSLGVIEPTMQREGSNRILIEMPGIQDPDEAIAMIGKTAFLSFGILNEEGDFDLILDGSRLLGAEEAAQQARGAYGTTTVTEYIVILDFDSEGRRVFAETTQMLVDRYPDLTISHASINQDFRRNIAIFLDDELISFPFVNSPIPGGEAVITGYGSLAEARQLALLLESGALPVPVEIVEKRTIGPTLGADSIEKSQVAGFVGLLLVVVFMVVVYRLPGLIAGFSLILYSVLLLGGMALLRATLTLPGILGVVLSIGMCVDSNIIINERIKDELNAGKTLRASIQSGFSRAMWTIIDSNATTLIVAAVLFWRGTGSIKGFAVTLTLGIAISLFTAVVYARYLLRSIAESGLFNNPVLYGGKAASR